MSNIPTYYTADVPATAVVAVLRRARDLIADRRDWCREAFAVTTSGTPLVNPSLIRHCAARRDLLGAIETASADADLQFLAIDALATVVYEAMGRYVSLQHLNEWFGHDAVLGALTDAIAATERKTALTMELADDALNFREPPTAEVLDYISGEHQITAMHYSASDRFAGMFNHTPSMRDATHVRLREIEDYLKQHSDTVRRLEEDEERERKEAESGQLVGVAGSTTKYDDIPF